MIGELSYDGFNNRYIKRGIILRRVSALDAQEWVDKLRKKEIFRFEYKELPIELKDIKLLRRAREEEYIVKVIKKVDGKNVWRLSDKTNYRGLKMVVCSKKDENCKDTNRQRVDEEDT